MWILCAASALADPYYEFARNYVPPTPPPIVLTTTEFRWSAPLPSVRTTTSWSAPPGAAPVAAPEEEATYGPTEDELLETDCANGYGDACYDLGQRRMHTTRWETAGGYFRRACVAGDPRGCLWLVPYEPEREAEHLARACDLGGGEGCTALGERLAETDPEGAEARWRQGCDLGDANACLRMAREEEDLAAARPWLERGCPADGEVRAAEACRDLGDLVAALGEPERAVGAWRLGCRTRGRGQGESCLRLGQALFHGQGAAADRRGALDALELACQLTGGDACLLAGGVAEGFDSERANAAYYRGCSGGFARACMVLGEREARSTPPDPSSAGLAYLNGCTYGDLQGCALGGHYLGVVAATSPYTPSDVMFALQRACDGGIAAACGDLGARRAVDPQGVDPAAVLDAYRKGCPGDGATCERLADLLRSRDPEGAATARRQACEAGSGESCLAVGELERACELSVAPACARLAETSPDPGPWRLRACEAGDRASCAELGGRIRPPLPAGTPVLLDGQGQCTAAAELVPHGPGRWRGRVACERGPVEGDLELRPLVVPPRMVVRLVEPEEGNPAGTVCTAIAGSPSSGGLDLWAWCPSGELRAWPANVAWAPEEDGPLPAAPPIPEKTPVKVLQALAEGDTERTWLQPARFGDVQWIDGSALVGGRARCVAKTDLVFEAGWYRGTVVCGSKKDLLFTFGRTWVVPAE